MSQNVAVSLLAFHSLDQGDLCNAAEHEMNEFGASGRVLGEVRIHGEDWCV